MEIKTPLQFGIGGRKSNAEWTFCLMRLTEIVLLQKKLTFRVAAKTTSSMFFNNFFLKYTHIYESYKD